MATIATHLMTVDEFLALPDDRSLRYELVHGEVIAMPPPKLKHQFIQGNICDGFRALAPAGSYIQIEVGFRPLPEYEFWVADVAYFSKERRATVNPDGNFEGAPDLIVEVLSPSNTAAAIFDREQICLANGAKEFWTADPKRQRIRVSTPNGPTVTYEPGQQVPLPLFGSDARIAVDDIFRY